MSWRVTDGEWRFVLTLITTVLFFSGNTCKAQVVQLNNVAEAFEKISDHPVLYDFKKTGVKIPGGGHLQGIQGWRDAGDDSSAYIKAGFTPIEYVAITGSSNTSSYYVTVRLNSKDGEDKVVSLQKLIATPYRHAGGCQLIDKKLFVGIEDNETKNKSRIMMISLPDTGKEGEKIIIERQGSYKRSTAGAVGVTQIHNDHYLVAVGDWDSRNIDFYISRLYSGKAFDSLTTFHAPDNEKWCSYQSINLLSDKAGNLFLIGFCLDENKNRADLFKVSIEKDGTVFVPVQTRYFKCPKGTSFRYGAGVRILNEQEIEIYACQRKLKRHNFISIFRFLPKIVDI